MKRIALVFSIVLTFILSATSQVNTTTMEWLFKELENAIQDSSYVDALSIIEKQIDITPNWGGNYYNQMLNRFRTNDLKGVCIDMEKAKNRSYKIPSHYNNYYNFFCNPDPGAQKYKKKFYTQKGLTEDNNYVHKYQKADSLRGTLSKEKACYDVHYYRLDIRIDPKKRNVRGFVEVRSKILNTTNRIQLDAHEDLKIDSIVSGNQKFQFQRNGNALFVNLPSAYSKDRNLDFKIFYKGKPAKAIEPPWEGGFVWRKNKSSKVWAAVACEHLGSSFWWPGKDHPSDEPDSMDVIIETLKPFKVVSNGNLVSETSIDEKFSRFHWHISYPINTYNVTFYIGNFEYYTEEYINSSGKHQLEFYVMPHNLERAKKHFHQSHEIIQFYEQAFGEYPFWKDGFALIESPYAGMEHQTAIAIGGDYGTETRRYYLHSEYDYLIVHEAAHEWWGNSVTAGDMCDAWLQEGFATYAELMFIEHKYGYGEYLSEIDSKTEQILNFWPVVGPPDVNDNAFIGGDIYQKGALFLHNLRTSIDNDSLFFSIVKEFAVSNKLKIVRTKHLQELVNLRTGRNFDVLFDAYLNKTAVPTLEYSFTKSDKNIELSYNWTNAPNGFEMPFCIKLSDKRFKKINATKTRQTITLENIKFFNFANAYVGLKNCPKNAYTYHFTRFKPE